MDDTGTTITDGLKIAFGHADIETANKALRAVIDQRDRLAAELREARAEIEQLVARPATDEADHLRAQVAELSLTLMTRDTEMGELVALITAWADAEDAYDALWAEGGTRTQTKVHEVEARVDSTLSALRKAVGR